MSRSTSIWVILDELATVRACFTVRHEMITWLKDQPDVKAWTAMRMPDNPGRFQADSLRARVSVQDIVDFW